VVQRIQKETNCLVEVASFNSSAQVVLSGSKAGISLAAQELSKLNIARKAAELPVNAPFHCSFMRPAAEEMRIALEKVEIREPRVPLVSGITAKPITSRQDIISHLVTNIFTPVKWFDCQNFLISNGVERFVFLGPGKALANMSRKEVERGVWKGDERGEKLEIETVATLDDLERLKELIMPGEEFSRKKSMESQVSVN